MFNVVVKVRQLIHDYVTIGVSKWLRDYEIAFTTWVWMENGSVGQKNECGSKKMSVDKKKWVCWVWVWVWSVECGVCVECWVWQCGIWGTPTRTYPQMFTGHDLDQSAMHNAPRVDIVAPLLSDFDQYRSLPITIILRFWRLSKELTGRWLSLAEPKVISNH